MRQSIHIAVLLVLGLLQASTASGMERFPPPDFESGYELPATEVSSLASRFRKNWDEYIDVVVLAGALGLAAYLALKKRSRRWLFVLMLFSLGYFGFWRKGCICSIGAIQNAALALAGGGYALPFTVIAFFILPLVSAVFFGRVFCASVCPLGVIQDVVLVRPVKVPPWLEHALGLLAYVYLGAAVIFAATDSAFIICRYDPFVSFFRLSGSVSMFVLGGSFLVIGMFIGRSYCRFLCPYGAILRPLSMVSKWHMSITPDECIQCRLCEDACPYGAILKPTEEHAADRSEGKGRLALLLVLLPVLAALGLWQGGRLGPALSRAHATVRLAERVRQEQEGLVEGTTDASDAFRETGRTPDELYEEASILSARFVTWARVLGAWIGFVIGMKLISLAVRRKRTGYEPDKGKCLSCGRCFMNCPHERDRLKETERPLPTPEQTSPIENA